MKAPHGRGWVHYGIGLLLNAIAFAGLGPMIGYIAFAVVFPPILSFVPTNSVRAPDQGAALDLIGALKTSGFLLTMAPFGIVKAYFLGAAPAASTGLFVGLSSSWLGERSLRNGGILVGAASSAICVLGELPHVAFVASASIAGGVAAAAMIRMTRGLRLRPMPLDVKSEVIG